MSWSFLADMRDRLRRKFKPVVYLDMETRSPHPPGARVSAKDILCMAYKIDDGPVKFVKKLRDIEQHARLNPHEAERLNAKLFAEIRRQHQLAHAADLRDFNQSWLTRKFLTCAAWARTIFKR